jgi:hypothetical protein
MQAAQTTGCWTLDTLDAAGRGGIIQDALSIESDAVINYCFPKTWPADREVRASIIGDWLQTEAKQMPTACRLGTQRGNATEFSHRDA